MNNPPKPLTAWMSDFRLSSDPPGRWRQFLGLWYTRREAERSQRDWLGAAGNGGVVEYRVYKVVITPVKA